MNILKKIFKIFIKLPSFIILLLIKFYQKCISPLFPSSCRYIPTCSEYAIIAIQKYGFLKGLLLAIKRIMRCHPGHPGGYDPVP